MYEERGMLQPQDDGQIDVVPSYIPKPCLKSDIKDFLPLTNPSLKDDEPIVDPNTGCLNTTELTKDLVHGLIDDHRNDGKVIIVPNKDDQYYEMHCGLERSYTEDNFCMLSGNFGKGGYGKTQWIKDKVTNTHIIRKQIEKPNFHSKEILALYKLNEMRQCHFPRLYGFMPYQDTINIYMEYGGFSFNKVVENLDFRYLLADIDCIKDIARQGFHALETLRKMGIIHMDIKPENLCLRLCDNGRRELKVCDLGSCVMMGSVDGKVVISGWTPAYMTPEMCRYALSTRPGWQSMWQKEEKLISTKNNVYQLGPSLLYLIHFRHWLDVMDVMDVRCPGWKQKDTTYIQTMIATKPDWLQTLIKPEWDDSFKAVLRGALCESSERITPQQALDILQERIVPVEIPVPCSSIQEAGTSTCGSGSRKRRSKGRERSSSDNLKLNALCINDEPPEKCIPKDEEKDLSVPGNLPNLAALFN